MIDTVLQAIFNGYDSLVQTFGSPGVLLAISATLVVLAIVELCTRRRPKPATEVC